VQYSVGESVPELPAKKETDPVTDPDRAASTGAYADGLGRGGPDRAGFDSAGSDSAGSDRAGFDPGNWPDAGEPPRERRQWPIGIIALCLAVLLAAAEVVGVLLAGNGQFGVATLIGQSLIVLTVLSFLLGLFAVIRGRGRGWGIAAMILSVLVNPLVLINLLALFGGV
jgi:hypothetical protein